MTFIGGNKTCYYCLNPPIVTNGTVILHHGVPVCHDHMPEKKASNYSPVDDDGPITPRTGLFGTYTAWTEDKDIM